MVYIVAIYFIPSAGVFSMVDNAIDWINLYSVGSAICFRNIYPLDSTIQRLDNGSLPMYITQPIDATAQLLKKQTTSNILTAQLLQL